MDISAETFQSIVKSLKTDGGSDKRRSPRVGLRGRVTIIPLAKDASRKPLSLMGRNISAQGMALLHDKPMEAGLQFILRLNSDGRASQSQAIVCTVVRCSELDSEFHEIGVEFIGELSSNAGDKGVMLSGGFFG